jgi:hypothetical protein
MNLKSAAVLLASCISLAGIVSPSAAAPAATGTVVEYHTATGPDTVLTAGTATWVDVPGLTATVNLSKPAPIVVGYNVTVQRGIASSEPCVAFLRAVIGGTGLTQTIIAVPTGTTTSGGQTVAATPAQAGSVVIKVQALQTTACTDLSVMTTPWGAGGTEVWGSTMTVMVFR